MSRSSAAGDARRRHDPPDRRAAGRQRPGLVEHDRVDPLGDLEGLAAADEDPCLGTTTGADHDRGRRGEPHRARAGDDEDRDERGQRQRETRFRAGDEPDDEGGRRHDQDDRHEDLGDPVGEALDRRLRTLGTLDEVDDARQRGVAPDAGRAHDERAGRVLGRPDDLVARPDRDRDRLTGQHRRIDRRPAFDHHAVDRDAVAGPDAQQIADRDGLERDLVVRAVAHDASRRRTEPDQPVDGAGRASLGSRLEPPTEQDEADDDRRRVEVGDRLDPGRLDQIGPDA